MTFYGYYMSSYNDTSVIATVGTFEYLGLTVPQIT